MRNTKMELALIANKLTIAVNNATNILQNKGDRVLTTEFLNDVVGAEIITLLNSFTSMLTKTSFKHSKLIKHAEEIIGYIEEYTEGTIDINRGDVMVVEGFNVIHSAPRRRLVLDLNIPYSALSSRITNGTRSTFQITDVNGKIRKVWLLSSKYSHDLKKVEQVLDLVNFNEDYDNKEVAAYLNRLDKKEREILIPKLIGKGYNVKGI